MPRNRLADETSPYLLQHADNPVDWYGWGEPALAKARAENKPILLSVGYAACHWCHVMAHESFENPEIAGLMNELFVNIKVDREERPDLDSIYQSALALLGEQGGWPLTMFLRPDGKPFWGGTYFPPTQRYGRPGFGDVLKTIAQIYERDREKIDGNVASLAQAMVKLQPRETTGMVPIAAVDEVAARLVREVDIHLGGIGGAPKFPQPSIFELFWRGWQRTGVEKYREAVVVTLDQLSAGGIYDHLGGGYARYSTDPIWLVPHFEKMLYDNAQLVSLLTSVWQENDSPVYAARVEETIGWLLREMMAEGGGFASSFDADSEGVEGKFYVWTEAEIDALLGAAAPEFKRIYDVQTGGNWEGHTILNRSKSIAVHDADEAALARSRAILFEHRKGRIAPGRDDKILADWNGLMIAALADAGMSFDRPDWIAAAEKAFGFICAEMVEDGRLRHSYRLGRARHTATLDDYANMAKAGLALYEATGNRRALAHAIAWVETLDRFYWDEEAGGYFLTASDATDLIVRTKNAHDNAVPSGNGTIVQVLTRLYNLTGRTRFRDRAEAVITAFSGELQRNFFPLSTLLSGVDLINRAVQIVVVGDRSDPATIALLREAWQHSLPNRVVMQIPGLAGLPPGHPAEGKDMIEGVPTVYVCVGPVCSLPMTNISTLSEHLKSL